MGVLVRTKLGAPTEERSDIINLCGLLSGCHFRVELQVTNIFRGTQLIFFQFAYLLH